MPLDSRTGPGGWHPKPPSYVAPSPNRPELLVDAHRVMLADPDGFLIGLNGDEFWQGGPPGNLVYASRETSRAF